MAAALSPVASLAPMHATMWLTYFEQVAGLSLLLLGALEHLLDRDFKCPWRTMGRLCRGSFLCLLLLQSVFNFSQLLLPLRGHDDERLGLGREAEGRLTRGRIVLLSTSFS